MFPQKLLDKDISMNVFTPTDEAIKALFKMPNAQLLQACRDDL